MTGATGFIGRQCVPLLAAAGFEVHAVSSRPLTQPEDPAVRWHQADLLDSEAMARLTAELKASHLLHLAWYAVPGKYAESVENLRWCQATIELSLRFGEHGGKRAVYAGTCFEYDPSFGYCTEGQTPLRPATLYGTCKRATHEVVEAFAQRAGIKAVWGHIFHLYGPHEAPTRLVPAAILALLRGERVRCSHGRQIRDFLHVADVAGALVALLMGELEGTVNIGSGEPVSIRTLVTAIARHLGATEDRIDFGAIPAPATDPPILVPNVARLRTGLSWTPQRTLEDGLAETVAWWRGRPEGGPDVQPQNRT